MKRVLSIITVMALLLIVTGCNLGKDDKLKVRGNCRVFDCIKRLDIDNNLDTINKVMGFNGELVKEEKNYKIYKWVTNEKKNESLQAVFYSKNTSISITFTDKDIKDKNIDFSQYEEIKRALNNREIVRYSDIKNKFKSEGVLTEKTMYTNKYKWVNKDGKYINATFNNSTNACTMIFGKI